MNRDLWLDAVAAFCPLILQSPNSLLFHYLHKQGRMELCVFAVLGLGDWSQAYDNAMPFPSSPGAIPLFLRVMSRSIVSLNSYDMGVCPMKRSAHLPLPPLAVGLPSSMRLNEPQVPLGGFCFFFPAHFPVARTPDSLFFFWLLCLDQGSAFTHESQGSVEVPSPSRSMVG